MPILHRRRQGGPRSTRRWVTAVEPSHCTSSPSCHPPVRIRPAASQSESPPLDSSGDAAPRVAPSPCHRRRTRRPASRRRWATPPRESPPLDLPPRESPPPDPPPRESSPPDPPPRESPPPDPPPRESPVLRPSTKPPVLRPSTDARATSFVVAGGWMERQRKEGERWVDRRREKGESWRSAWNRWIFRGSGF